MAVVELFGDVRLATIFWIHQNSNSVNQIMSKQKPVTWQVWDNTALLWLGFTYKPNLSGSRYGELYPVLSFIASWDHHEPFDTNKIRVVNSKSTEIRRPGLYPNFKKLLFKIEMALRLAVNTIHAILLFVIFQEYLSMYPHGSLTIYYPKQGNKVIEALTFTPLVSFNFTYPVFL